MPTRLRGVLWLAMSLLAVSHASGDEPAPQAGNGGTRYAPEEILRKCLSNRTALKTLTCRFNVVETTAANWSDGLKGIYSEPEVVHKGIWVLNGAKERMQVDCNPDVLKKLEADLKNAGPGESVSVPVVLENYRTDGRFEVRASNHLGLANLRYPGNLVGVHDRFFDGHTILAHLSEPVRSDKLRSLVNGPVRKDGKELISVSLIDSNYAVPAEYEVLFDPAAGFLSVEFVAKHPEVVWQKFITKTRRIANDVWFPECVVSMDLRAEGVRVLRTDVTSLTTAIPSEHEFDLDVTDFLQFSDIMRPETTIDPSRIGIIKIGNLQAIADRLDQQLERANEAPEKRVELAKIAGGSAFPVVIAVISGIAVVAVGVLGIFLVLRQQRRDGHI